MRESFGCYLAIRQKMKNSVVEILVPKGEPSGLRIVKLAGWIGRAFVIPRADLSEIKDMPEASYPAVYFLFGEPDGGKPVVYIGQTDEFFRRIDQQDSGRSDSDWNIALVFTGESDIAVEYLEKRCVDDARESARYEIKNISKPPGKKISTFGKAVNDDFLEKMKFITTLLGFPMFLSTPKEKQAEDIYFFKTEDAFGKGTLLENGEFVVYAGSTARIRATPSFELRDPGIRGKLEDLGILKRQNNNISFEFVKDHIFTSPSAAGDTVAGRSVNGWTAWRDEGGKTLDECRRRAGNGK